MNLFGTFHEHQQYYINMPARMRLLWFGGFIFMLTHPRFRCEIPCLFNERQYFS
jgi:hypothetical protein